jgi:hypothetical protein
MELRFRAGGELYSELYPAPGTSSTVWPVSQALAATAAVASLPHVGIRYRPALRASLAIIERYWDPTEPAGYRPAVDAAPGSPRYYDDNEWLGLDLVAASRILHDPSLLARAEQVFAFVVTGWDADAGHACPGGVFWTSQDASGSRNTVSTANGALLGLELYRATGDPGYLSWASAMYSWELRCLRRADGLYADSIAVDGRIDQTVWSYNQGAMVAAGVLFYEVTGDPGYLRAATSTARVALRFFSSRLAAEPPEFVAIFFRDLDLLDRTRPAPAYRQALSAYSAWAARFRDSHGLYRPAHEQQARLLAQAALVQIRGLLAGA